VSGTGPGVTVVAPVAGGAPSATPFTSDASHSALLKAATAVLELKLPPRQELEGRPLPQMSKVAKDFVTNQQALFARARADIEAVQTRNRELVEEVKRLQAASTSTTSTTPSEVKQQANQENKQAEVTTNSTSSTTSTTSTTPTAEEAVKVAEERKKAMEALSLFTSTPQGAAILNEFLLDQAKLASASSTTTTTPSVDVKDKTPFLLFGGLPVKPTTSALETSIAASNMRVGDSINDASTQPTDSAPAILNEIRTGVNALVATLQLGSATKQGKGVPKDQRPDLQRDVKAPVPGSRADLAATSPSGSGSPTQDSLNGAINSSRAHKCQWVALPPKPKKKAIQIADEDGGPSPGEVALAAAEDEERNERQYRIERNFSLMAVKYGTLEEWFERKQQGPQKFKSMPNYYETLSLARIADAAVADGRQVSEANSKTLARMAAVELADMHGSFKYASDLEKPGTPQHSLDVSDLLKLHRAVDARHATVAKRPNVQAGNSKPVATNAKQGQGNPDGYWQKLKAQKKAAKAAKEAVTPAKGGDKQ
jgi:hypothetical protein